MVDKTQNIMVDTTPDSLSRRTLTIPEVARLLGIGRTLAYDEARLHGTIAGIPVIRIGRRLLVACAAVERLLNESTTT